MMFEGLLSRDNKEQQFTEMPIGELFNLLRNERRRIILQILSDSGPLSRTELARELTAHETDGKREGQAYKKRYVSVYQTHLPALEEKGLVDVTEDAVVRPTEKTDGVLQFLSKAEAHSGGDR